MKNNFQSSYNYCKPNYKRYRQSKDEYHMNILKEDNQFHEKYVSRKY